MGDIKQCGRLLPHPAHSWEEQSEMPFGHRHLFDCNGVTPTDEVGEMASQSGDDVETLRAEIRRRGRLLQMSTGEIHALHEEIEMSGLGAMVARFSNWIDGSYPDDMHPELVLRRRVDKLMEECGEVGQALGGWTGENPRKGVTHTKEDVMGELLDVAFTALGAWEHIDGNHGRSAEALEGKAAFVLNRVGLLPVTPTENGENN